MRESENTPRTYMCLDCYRVRIVGQLSDELIGIFSRARTQVLSVDSDALPAARVLVCAQYILVLVCVQTGKQAVVILRKGEDTVATNR